MIKFRRRGEGGKNKIGKGGKLATERRKEKEEDKQQQQQQRNALFVFGAGGVQ